MSLGIAVAAAIMAATADQPEPTVDRVDRDILCVATFVGLRPAFEADERSQRTMDNLAFFYLGRIEGSGVGADAVEQRFRSVTRRLRGDADLRARLLSCTEEARPHLAALARLGQPSSEASD